ADRSGLLEQWTTRIEAGARSTRGLFLSIFVLGLAVSSLLNNDAAILVLTPSVLKMVKRRFPGQPRLWIAFAFVVFMSAGVAALPISNPMNMIVAEISGIGFFAYARRMAPVAIAGWVVSYTVLRAVYAKEWRQPMPPSDLAVPRATPTQRALTLVLLSVLAAYPLVAYVGGPAWSVAFAGALISLIIARQSLRVNPLELAGNGVSWDTLGFLLAALVISRVLRDVGLVDRLAQLYAHSGLTTIGAVSAVGSAILNNHPMAHLNLMALQAAAPGETLPVFAALIGGDLGPRLLPTGSLAGLLWLEQLRRHGADVRLRDFLGVGALLALSTLAVTLLVLRWA
ncbi:MAG: SLC13 family permease, partial [Myxococcaceae bacterium]